MHPIEQKQERMKILMSQSTPLELVRAWDFFRRVYLRPMGRAFYRTEWVESPPFHYQMVYDLGNNARNAVAAPRGSAKSSIIGMEIPLFLLLTRPYYTIVLGLATDSLIEARFDVIMSQLTTNPLIIEDFGLQKPNRGDAIFNRHHIHLLNGSDMQGFSVMGKKRGARPNLFILDDPESDPDSDSKESMQLLLEKFERILFRQIIPMLEYGSAIFWIGTLINRKSFLYHATCTDDTRFSYWNRRVYAAVSSNQSDPTHVNVLWPDKWSKERLEARRAEIGEAAFKSEYLNDPTSETERQFVIDARKNEYSVNPDTIDTAYETDPCNSSAEVLWYEKPDPKIATYAEVKKLMKDWLSDMFIVICVDYAQGLSSHNDYSCIGVFGFDTKNTLWILDMWMGRVKEAVLQDTIYKYGLKWRVKVVGIESASVQISYIDQVISYFGEKCKENWRPRIAPIKYPANTDKGGRIAGLDWRYGTGKIKYPAHLKDRWPFSQLYTQTLDFTPDLMLLPFDDAIDTVAMTRFLVHARGANKQIQEVAQDSVSERVRTGKPPIAGMPLLVGIDPLSLSAEDLVAVEQLAYQLQNKKKQKSYFIRPRVTG
jgi:hypothetical protein